MANCGQLRTGADKEIPGSGAVSRAEGLTEQSDKHEKKESLRQGPLGAMCRGVGLLNV